METTMESNKEQAAAQPKTEYHPPELLQKYRSIIWQDSGNDHQILLLSDYRGEPGSAFPNFDEGEYYLRQICLKAKPKGVIKTAPIAVTIEPFEYQRYFNEGSEEFEWDDSANICVYWPKVPPETHLKRFKKAAAKHSFINTVNHFIQVDEGKFKPLAGYCPGIGDTLLDRIQEIDFSIFISNGHIK